MLYSPSVYRMMSKKPSEGSLRASSRDRSSSRKTHLPLEREATTLSLKEKLLLLHFHDNEPETDTESVVPDGPELDTVQHKKKETDAVHQRKKFERSITAPNLPLNQFSVPNSDGPISKKQSITAAAIQQDQPQATPSRKRSEMGTMATLGRTKNQQKHLDAVKQAIGGFSNRLKKGANWGTASTTTNASGRSGSGSG